jgi:hypothetical protein
MVNFGAVARVGSRRKLDGCLLVIYLFLIVFILILFSGQICCFGCLASFSTPRSDNYRWKGEGA